MNRQMLVMGAGAGTGALIPIVLQKYVDLKYPTGVFGIKLSTLIPVATGAIGLGVTLFTDIIKNDDLKNFIMMYSFPAIFAGILNYINGTSASARGYQQQRASANRYTTVTNPYPVVSKVPSQQNISRQIGAGRSGISSGVIIA